MERDGNPIFDARNDKLGRAIRIIQDRIANERLDFSAWVNSREEDEDELPRHELVVSLAFSEESSRLTEEVFKVWMAPDRTVEDVKIFIRNQESKGPRPN